MDTEKKPGRKVPFFRIFSLVVLLGLVIWSFELYRMNYESMESSNRILMGILDDQTAVTQSYIKELTSIRKNLTQTEQLLARVQEENKRLNQQVELAGEFSQLQKSIADLKAENAQILADISLMKKENGDFNSVGEGRDIIAKFRQKIHNVKVRIGEIKHNTALERVLAQKEKDKLESLLGNNGFLVKNGEALPVNPRTADRSKDIKVDVTFVK